MMLWHQLHQKGAGNTRRTSSSLLSHCFFDKRCRVGFLPREGASAEEIGSSNWITDRNLAKLQDFIRFDSNECWMDNLKHVSEEIIAPLGQMTKFTTARGHRNNLTQDSVRA